MAKHILLFSPQMEDLAREIAEEYPDEIALGHIDFKRFRDRSPNTKVQGADQLAAQHVTFLMCLDDEEANIEQLSTHLHLAGRAPRTYRVILPYYKYATMERSPTEDQVITAKTVLQLLNACGPVGPGKVPLYIYDIHALAEKDFVDVNLVMRLKSGLKLLFKALKGRENLTIVYPDEGALKRFERMPPVIEAKQQLGFETVCCFKSREDEGDGREVVIKGGRVHGRNTVIIDDLLRTGGTLIECAKALWAAGAASVDAYCTHTSYLDNGWQRFDGSVIRTFYTTNSCPAAAKAVRGNPNVVVFSLRDSIANAIREGVG